MNEAQSLLIFHLEELSFAIPLASVDRAIRAVEITPFVEVSGKVLGLLNLHGQMVPVVNTRRMMGLPEREIVPEDVFIIVQTGIRTLALVVDGVEQIAEFPVEEILPASSLSIDAHTLTGITRLTNKIILIHDLEKCLSAQETDLIEQAIKENSSPC